MVVNSCNFKYQILRRRINIPQKNQNKMRENTGITMTVIAAEYIF